MGVCLCKEKVPDGHSTAGGDAPGNDSTSPFRGSADSRPDRIWRKVLSETVDTLVLETLQVIGSIVDK